MSEWSVEHALSPSESTTSITLSELPLTPLKRKRFDDRSRSRTSIQLQNHASVTPREPDFDLILPKAIHLEKLVKWTDTKQILKTVNSEEFNASFGSAVSIELSAFHIAIGTEKGGVVGFNYHQNVNFILILSEDSPNVGSVSSIAFSSDSTFVAAGYVSGEIVVWDLLVIDSLQGNYSLIEPYYVILPITLEDRFARNLEGHLVDVTVNTVSFIGNLHSHLVSSDVSGLVFFHYGFKKFLKKYFTSHKLLGKNDRNNTDSGKFMIEDCKVLPIGTSPQITDHIGVLAVMTANILAIVSIRSLNNTNYAHPITHFKISKSKLVDSSDSARGSVSWYPCIQMENSEVQNAKLAYCWNNVLTVVELDNNSLSKSLMADISEMKDKDKGIPKLPVYKTGRWNTSNRSDRIVSLEWLNSEILTALVKQKTGMKLFFFYYSNAQGKTIFTELGVDDLDTQQVSWNVLDLGNPNHEIQSYHNSFKIFRHRMMLLVNAHSFSHKSLKTGKCLKWADRLMDYLAEEDFLAALLTANDYYSSENLGQLVLCGLPHSSKERHDVVKPFLIQIMRESITSLFGTTTESIDHRSTLQIYMHIISLLTKDSGGPVTNELLDILELVYETYEDLTTFFHVLEAFVLSQQISNLSPLLFKSLVEFYVSAGEGETLTEAICLLDTRTLNIDMTLLLCLEYKLRECSIYIWNELLHDYITPLFGLLQDLELTEYDDEEKLVVYTYMSYILTGRQFPRDQFLNADEEKDGREALCGVLFSIGPIDLPMGPDRFIVENDSVFPYLFRFLSFNTFEMLVTLNEFFEHPYLNNETPGHLNRQYIIEALLDIFEANQTKFVEDDFTQLSIFIARNYPKYFQFIRLSETVLHTTVDTLCNNRNAELRNDCELALESLLPVYDVESDGFLLEQMKAAKFYDALFGIYKSEKKYSKALEVWLEKQRDTETIDYEKNFAVLANILEIMFGANNNNVSEQRQLIQFVEEHFEELISRNLEDMVVLANSYNPELHRMVLKCTDDVVAFKYLDALFNLDGFQTGNYSKVEMICKYIRLLGLFAKSRVNSVVSRFAETLSANIEEKSSLKTYLKEQRLVTALSVLLLADDQYEDALEELIAATSEVMENLTTLEKSKNLTNGHYDGGSLIEEDGLADIDSFIGTAINICKISTELWIPLVESLVEMADYLLPATESLNKGLYNCFRSMLEGDVKSFSKVFNHIVASAKLSNVRAILQEILTSYFFDSEMHMVTLQKINQGIYKSMESVKTDVLLGWLVSNQNCTSCGKIMWGSDISTRHEDAWEEREKCRVLLARDFGRSDFKDCELVLFKCMHGYHSQCLAGLGSSHCVICNLH